ncbi:putative nucleic acid-binding protein [Helianthus annuus]|nr:putative nucleic acid-binding protein [Helianthus annuus]
MCLIFFHSICYPIVLMMTNILQYQLESVSSCNPGVNVSLWGHLVNQFSDGYIRRIAKNTVVIILSSCKVRSYKGMVESPQITINEDNAATFQITSIANIYSLLTAGDVAEGTIFNIDANISGVEMHSDWKYVKCNKCHKKASMVDGYYLCWNCEEDVVNPHYVYKLELCVTNGNSDEMTCVVFNEATGVDDPNWIESYLNENLCSRMVIFVIKIDPYNLAPKFSNRFTVSKYLGDDINALIQPRSISTTADAANPPSAGVLQIDEETEMCAKIKDVIVGNGRDASLTQSVVQPRSISTSVDAATPPLAGVLQIDEETEMCAKIKDVKWEMADEVFSSVVDNSVTPSTQSSIIGDNKTAGNHLQPEVEVIIDTEVNDCLTKARLQDICNDKKHDDNFGQSTMEDIGNDKKHDDRVGQSVMKGIVGTEQYEGSARQINKEGAVQYDQMTDSNKSHIGLQDAVNNMSNSTVGGSMVVKQIGVNYKKRLRNNLEKVKHIKK